MAFNQVPRSGAGDSWPGWGNVVIPQTYPIANAGMQHEVTSAGSGYGSNSGGERSPLSNIPFLKGITSEKKQTTKDGEPAKRRGPKPDSKPALTRRQELNRQAQRTHRERKEQYIKALEQEVLRLKDTFAESTREREKILDENRKLKALLAQNGISYDFGKSPVKFQRENSGYGPSSSGSISGSYRPGSDSTGFSPPSSHGLPMQMQQVQHQQVDSLQQPQMRNNLAQPPDNNIEYDQIGIDFVLTLERPCMDHMQYLVIRSHNPEEQDFKHPLENADDREYDHMSGHALMATCPTYSHIKNKPNEPYPFKMPELGTPDLDKLLALSSRLPLGAEGEITPVMAWTQIWQDPRLGHLTKEDLLRIRDDLSTKVRCYGFGAVLEEFELNDSVESIFAEKSMQTLEASFSSPQVAIEA